MKSTIVVPTIREESIKEFINQWTDQLRQQRVIVVEDHPTKQFSLPGWVEHYCHADIDKELADDTWIISRTSSSIRNFGTYKAVQKPTDMIWHLDDDCFPITGYELETHWDNLFQPYQINAWESTDDNGYHVRGMPYYNRSKDINVVVSHGTWTQNPDYDAIHQLGNRFDFTPNQGIVNLGDYFSMCGMNLAFKPSVAAAMYFAPSGPNQPYDRIDDIWMGIIAKRVFDYLRYYCSTGYPQIRHDRASDPFKNMIKEAPGMEPNENFWQYIDVIDLKDCDTIYDCLEYISWVLEDEPYLQQTYFKKYGQALLAWAERIYNAQTA